VPAIFAITKEPFLVLTSNVFAILGLRAMYFLLADLMHRFIYLKLGLGLVLIWVGIKLVLQVDVYKMPTWLSLGVVAMIIAVSVAASLIATRRGDEASDMDSVIDGDERAPDDDRAAQEVDVSDQSRSRAGLRPPQS
jgi:tellurite resistance protein TerC